MSNDDQPQDVQPFDEVPAAPRMEVIHQVGESVCTFLNGSKLLPNEAFIMLLSVFGAVAQAASVSLMDQLQMRIRFANALLEIGHEQLTKVDQVPAPKTPQ